MRLISKILFTLLATAIISCNKDVEPVSNGREFCEFGVENVNVSTETETRSTTGTVEGAKMQITLILKSSLFAHSGMYHYESGEDRLIADGTDLVVNDPEGTGDGSPDTYTEYDWAYISLSGQEDWYYKTEKDFVVGETWGYGTYTDHKLYVYYDTYYLLAASKNSTDVEDIKPTLGFYTSDTGSNTGYPCPVYNVQRNSEDNLYIGSSGESFYINYTNNVTDNQYIYDAGLELKQQISKMKFQISSNAGGHEILSIKLKNYIDELDYCVKHSQHISDTNIMTEGFPLSYGENDGSDGSKFTVTDPKFLTAVGESDENDFINLLSLDYSQKSDEGLPYYPVPYIEVQYVDENNTLGNKAIKILPINFKLDPQTKYQLDMTLTMTMIKVTISEYKNGWDEGSVSDSELDVIDSYSVELDSTIGNDWDNDWDNETQI